MAEKKTYKIGDQVVDVPVDKVDVLLEKYPDAKEMASYIIKGDTVDVPLEKEALLLEKYPDAKPTYVKKKDGGEGSDSTEMESISTSPGKLVEMAEAGEIPAPEPLTQEQELGLMEQPEPTKPYETEYPPEFVAQGQALKEWADATQEERDKFIEEQRKKHAEWARKNIEKLSTDVDEKLKKSTQDIDALKLQLGTTLKEMKDVSQMYADDPNLQTILNEYQQQTQSMHKDVLAAEASHKELWNAKEILKKAKKYDETKDAGVFKSLLKSQYFLDYVSFGLNEMQRNIDILEVAKKPESERTEEENIAITAYGLKQELESVTDQTISSIIGSGIAETIPFMVEFALSGGTSTTAKAGTRKFLKDLAEKQANKYVKKVLKKAPAFTRSAIKEAERKSGKYITKPITKLSPIAETAIAAGARTPFLTSEYAPGVPSRMIGQVAVEETETGEFKTDVIGGEDFQTALTKTLASTYLSAVVEGAGEGIQKVGGKVKQKVLHNTIAGKKLLKASDYLTNKLPAIPGSNFLSSRMVREGFDLVGLQSGTTEAIEELIEMYGQPAITGDQKLSEVWDTKQVLGMLGTVFTIGGFRKGIDMGFRYAYDDRAMIMRQYKDAAKNIKPETKLELDKILKGDDIGKNAEQLDQYIEKKLIDGAVRDDIERIVDYYKLKTYVDQMNNGQAIIEQPLTPEERQEIADSRAESKEAGEELPPEDLTPQIAPIEPTEIKTETNEKEMQKGDETPQEKVDVGEKEVLKPEYLPETEIPRKVYSDQNVVADETHVALDKNNAVTSAAFKYAPEKATEYTLRDDTKIADVSKPEVVEELKNEARRFTRKKDIKKLIDNWKPENSLDLDPELSKPIHQAAQRLGYHGITKFGAELKDPVLNVWNVEQFEGVNLTHDDLVNRAADRSTDTNELYSLFSLEDNNYDNMQPWQQDLVDKRIKFSPESIKRVMGLDVKEGFAPGWVAKEGKGENLEEYNSFINEDVAEGVTLNVSQQDIIDFLEQYPTHQSALDYTPNQSKLAARYYEIVNKKIGIQTHGKRQRKVQTDFHKFLTDNKLDFSTFDAIEQSLENNKDQLTKKQYNDFRQELKQQREAFERGTEGLELDDVQSVYERGPKAETKETRPGIKEKTTKPTKKPVSHARKQQGRPVRVEGKKEKGKSVSDKNLPEIDRPKLQDRKKSQEKKIDRKSIDSRAKKSIKRIGDITKKKPVDLVKESKSVEELDYIYEQFSKEIPFKEYNKHKSKLREKDQLDDELGRTSDIQDQILEEKAKLIDEQIKQDVGSERYDQLKSKRSESIDKINDSLARLAHVKYATGDGKKLDVGKEFVSLVKEMAKVGIIDIQLGTKAVMDKLRTYFEKYLPEKVHLVDQYENLIARELGTREFDKKLKEADVDSITENISNRLNEREKTENQVNQSKKKSAKEWARRMLVDESEPFKVELIKTDSKLGQRAVDYFNLQAGVSGKDMVEYEHARKQVLGGFKDLLSQDEQIALAEYINYKRVIELDNLYDKRGTNRLDHEGGLTKEEAEITLDALRNNNYEILQAHGINQDIDWGKIDKRAEAYWNLMQEKLSDLRKEGLITEEVYQKLKTEQPYYTPRRYLTHFIGNVDPGGSISGIETLSGGSMGSILADTQTLMADVISRANKSIARNKTMNALYDVANEVENDVVKPAPYTVTKKVNGKEELGYLDKLEKEEQRLTGLEEKLRKEGRSEKEIEDFINAERTYIEPTFQEAPAGYTTYKFKKDGQTKAIYLNDRYMEDFEQKPDSESMRVLKNTLSWVSGNKILKAFATGYNPEFAIKNLPLDMLHILSTTEAYSPVLPVASAQLGKDILKVSKDAFTKKGRYLEYVKEGGSMEFLSTEGSLSPRKFKAYTKLGIAAKGLANGAAYLGNTSELLTRLALRERMIDNYTTEFKNENNRNPNQEELQQIKERATAYTRNYLDFSQGGKAIKFMNSVVPYLNAGFQVTRGSLRAAARNPKVFWFKMAQLGSTAAVITAWNLGLTPWGDDDEKEERKQFYLNDISARRKADNFIVMTPLSYEKGDKKHYVYFAFPKDNLQKLFTGIIEGSVQKSIGIENSLLNERRWMEFTSLTQNVTDIGNLPPIQRAILGSSMNKDLYYKTDLWSGKDFGADRFQEYTPELTPDRYIKAAEWSREVSEAFGLEKSLSPVRMQYFVSQFTTKSNVLSTVVGEAFDATIVGINKETQNAINKNMAERLVTAPFTRRFFKKTSPYIQTNNAEKEQQKVNVERQINDNKIKPFLKKDDIAGAVNVILDIEDPFEAQRLFRKVLTDAKLTGLDYRTRAMMFMPSGKARARVWYKYYSEADQKGKNELIKQSIQSKVILSGDEFKFELTQLMGNNKKQKAELEQLFE